MKYRLMYQQIKIPNELKIILCSDIGMNNSFSVYELNSYLNKKGLILNFFESVVGDIDYVTFNEPLSGIPKNCDTVMYLLKNNNILLLLQLRKYIIQDSYIIIGPVEATDIYQFSQERLIKIIFTGGEARIYRNIYNKEMTIEQGYIKKINNINNWKLEFTTESNSIFWSEQK